VLVAGFGLFLCTGLLEALAPTQFRLVKHLFYATIMALLLVEGRRALRIAVQDPVLWLLVGLICVSALWSELPIWSLKRGLVILQTTAFGLYLASRFSLDAQVWLLAWTLVPTLGISLVASFVAPAAAFMPYAHDTALTGLLVHKNAMGLLMALALPALLIQATAATRHRWVMWLALALALGLLVLSRSLTGALIGTTLCGVVVLAPFARRIGWPPLLLLPCAIVALGTLGATTGLLDGLLGSIGKDATLTGRTQIWEAAWSRFSERPLLGHSIASFWQLEAVESTGIWFSTAHNGYLQLLIDLGIVGLALFSVHLLSTLSRAVRVQGFPIGRSAVWAVCIASLVLLYNLVEVVLMAENSIVWVLYVAASFAVRLALPRDARFSAPASARSRGTARKLKR
jgi:O-antigen ligase